MESSGQRKLSAVPSFVPEEDAASRLLDVVWDVPIGLGLCDTGLNFVRVNEALAGLDGLPVDAHYELFPGVCHLHYPALSRIVEETCAAHRVQYRCEPTLRSALAANVRWLRRMGSATSLDVTTSCHRPASDSLARMAEHAS